MTGWCQAGHAGEAEPDHGASFVCKGNSSIQRGWARRAESPAHPDVHSRRAERLRSRCRRRLGRRLLRARLRVRLRRRNCPLISGVTARLHRRADSRLGKCGADGRPDGPSVRRLPLLLETLAILAEVTSSHKPQQRLHTRTACQTACGRLRVERFPSVTDNTTLMRFASASWEKQLTESRRLPRQPPCTPRLV